jgi:hypothetical protein
LVIHSSGTRLDAGSTTPYTTHDTDPTFHVTFDLTTYIRLSMGPRANAVMAPKAVLVLSNAQFTPDNASANDLQTVQSLLQSFFGGQSFAQTIASAIDSQQITITNALAPAIKTANNELRQQAPAGFVVAGIFADPQYLNFVLAPHVQPDAGGQMTGMLTVTGESNLPAGARSTPTNPQVCTTAIALSDTVQVQPDYVGSLDPVTIQTGSGPTQVLDSQIVVNAASIAPSANGFSCHYVVGGLADRMVNNVQFREPSVKATNGSLPSVGYVINISFGAAGCGSVGGGTGLTRMSDVACLTTPVCTGTLIPQNGQPLNCNLSGLIAMSGSGGVGVLRQSAVANPAAMNPGGPVESSASVSPSVWGAQNVNRTSVNKTSAAWGTSATMGATAPSAGMVVAPAAPGTAPGSAIGRSVVAE